MDRVRTESGSVKDDENPRQDGGSGGDGGNTGGGGGSGGDGEGPDEGDSARERSLQLGGGVPFTGRLGRYAIFLGEVREEMRKVTWPTRKMVVTETIVVIIFVIFFTCLITGLDEIFSMVFNKVLFNHKFPWE